MLLQRLWPDLTLTMVDSMVARRAQRVGIMKNGKLSIRQDTRPAPSS